MTVVWWVQGADREQALTALPAAKTSRAEIALRFCRRRGEESTGSTPLIGRSGVDASPGRRRAPCAVRACQPATKLVTARRGAEQLRGDPRARLVVEEEDVEERGVGADVGQLGGAGPGLGIGHRRRVAAIAPAPRDRPPPGCRRCPLRRRPLGFRLHRGRRAVGDWRLHVGVNAARTSADHHS